MTTRCEDCREGRHYDCLGDTVCECTHEGLDALQEQQSDTIRSI